MKKEKDEKKNSAIDGSDNIAIYNYKCTSIACWN